MVLDNLSLPKPAFRVKLSPISIFFICHSCWTCCISYVVAHVIHTLDVHGERGCQSIPRWLNELLSPYLILDNPHFCNTLLGFVGLKGRFYCSNSYHLKETTCYLIGRKPSFTSQIFCRVTNSDFEILYYYKYQQLQSTICSLASYLLIVIIKT